MKKKYSVFRELWAVPKYKTLIKLGGYLFFFIIFYAIAALGRDYEPKEITSTVNKSYSTMKKDLLSSNLTIKYKIDSHYNYYLEGTIIDNILNGTLEFDEIVKKIKIEDEIIYNIQKNEEIEDNNLLNDINIIYLFPENIIKILNDNTSLMRQSDDKKIYSYTIDEKSYSVFLDNEKIEKIIILDGVITYTLEYNLIK